MADDTSAPAPVTSEKVEVSSAPPSPDAPAIAPLAEGSEAAPASEDARKDSTDDGK
jgi:hypothetical protein